MILRDYQKEIITKVKAHLTENQRCCVSLATGGGKTVVFSELVKSLPGRTLIAVHREELVYQTSATLTLNHDVLLPKIKHVSKDICVAMVQTLHNRLKRQQIDINSFDNLIVDECHRGEFMKILDQFKGKVIGFTATPNYEKMRYYYKCLKCGSESDKTGDCCKRKLKKYKQNVPLAHYYKTLIHGIEINELIEQGYLVKDENFILDIDTTRLVYDEARGDYTEESISLVFGSPEAIQNTIRVYRELAFGKKTILFNPNTLVNKRLYEAMVLQGLNVKMYDSNNSDENRSELVDWFKNTPDAILLNVHVFTTGFDCTDVEVVFLNKKTKSINLFLQMVGRGGRITDKVFKPSFRVIDMGGNVADLGGPWSAKRDWNHYFSSVTIKEVGPSTPAAVRTCESCEAIIPANAIICPECGQERKYTNGGASVTGLPKRNGKPVIPLPNQIIEYCEKNDLETLAARKIVYSYASDMFEGVKFETFRKHKATGYLFNKARNYFMPYYFAIQRSKLDGNRVRTLDSFTNEIIKNIERRYSTSGDL
jgi:superfamily II DNA or RNA helicase